MPTSKHVLDLSSTEGVADNFYEYIPAYSLASPGGNLLNDEPVNDMKQDGTPEWKLAGSWAILVASVKSASIPAKDFVRSKGLSRRTYVVLILVLLGALAAVVAIKAISQANKYTGTATAPVVVDPTSALPTTGGTAFRTLFPKADLSLIGFKNSDLAVPANYIQQAGPLDVMHNQSPSPAQAVVPTGSGTSITASPVSPAYSGTTAAPSYSTPYSAPTTAGPAPATNLPVPATQPIDQLPQATQPVIAPVTDLAAPVTNNIAPTVAPSIGL